MMSLQIAGEYHPRYSLLRPLGRIARAARGPAGYMRGMGDLASSGRGGCLIAVIAFGLIVVLIWYAAAFLVTTMILPIGVAVAYGIWTHRRWQDWQRELKAAWNRSMGGAHER
jgi:hypothetical protein